MVQQYQDPAHHTQGGIMADDKSSSTSWSWRSRLTTVKVFTCGFVAGLLYLRSVRVLQRLRLPSLARIQTSVLPMLRANSEVRHHVGSSLKPGLLSAHAYTGGLQWKYPRLGRSLNWRQALPFYHQPWGVRMLFQVIGEHSTALVALETQTDSQHTGVVRYKMLTVDFNSGERLVLKGDSEQTRPLEFPTLQMTDR